MSDDLTLSCRILTPSGWLQLEDETNGYVLHAESFASRQYTARKTDIDNEWVRGSYTVRATTGNVTEQLVTWVTGADQLAFRTRFYALTQALEQLQFQMEVSIGNAKETMFCMYAGDYTLETNQTFMAATRGLVRANIPRLPDVILGSA